MYIIRPVGLIIFIVHLLPQSGNLTAQSCTIQFDSLLFGWFGKVKSKADGIARTSIRCTQGIDKHLHGIRYIDIHREGATGVKLDSGNFLLSHDVVALDDGEESIHLIELFLRNLLVRSNNSSLYHYIATMQTILAQLGTGIVF